MNFKTYLFDFLKANLVWLLAYQILRLAFALKYYDFNFINWSKIFEIIYWGFRIDFTGLILFNTFYVFVYLFNQVTLKQASIDSINRHVYISLNLFFIALNIVDLIYFEYNNRRLSANNLHLLTNAFGSFYGTIKMYWLPFIIGLMGIITLYRFQHKILKSETQHLENLSTKKTMFLMSILLLLTFHFATEKYFFRPITPTTALLYCDAQYQPVVNNTTLNILYSAYKGNNTVEKKSYFTDNHLHAIFTLNRDFYSDNAFSRKNVVVFLMESISYEHLEDERIMPFLSKIKEQSLDFSHVYQNGHESVHGSVAVFTSIPPIIDEPLYMSDFASIKYNAIGSIMRDKGYSNHFFLGAEYNHFNFSKLAKMLDIEHYHSGEAFFDKTNFDGTWGLYDAYFLDYFSKNLSTIKQPFFSIFYNISTHPPFVLPRNIEQKYKNLTLNEQEKCILYFDESLSNFFAQNSNAEWFNNSIFLFISDHTLILNKKRTIENFSEDIHIPFFIYDPSADVTRKIDRYGQQLDFIPTLLDYLNYSGRYQAFGKSLLQENDHNYFITMDKGVLRYQSKTCILGFDFSNDRVAYAFNKNEDNWIKIQNYDSLKFEIDFTKAFVQRYFKVLSQNSMTP